MNPLRSETFSGVVLAGGRSKRFGRDKAVAPYHGRILLLRVLDSLTEAAERYVVANRPRPVQGFPTRPDIVVTGSALSGLHAALAYARHPWVAIAACDLPHLTPDYWRLLWLRRHGRQAVVVRHESGELEPLAALYHRSALPLAEARLLQGSYALHGLVTDLDTRYLAAREVRLHSPLALRNLNSPRDLARGSRWFPTDHA